MNGSTLRRAQGSHLLDLTHNRFSSTGSSHVSLRITSTVGPCFDSEYPVLILCGTQEAGATACTPECGGHGDCRFSVGPPQGRHSRAVSLAAP